MVTGSCLCGNIQYELHGDPINTAMCFCDNCRKSTGSIGMANGWYSKEARADTLRTYQDHATDSGATVERSFCPDCGSPVIAENKTKFPGAVIVTYGTMELESGRYWKPELEYFCKRKVEWLGTPVETKKFYEL
ncbi:Glutathione-dependent formaldehyde-activating enzyme/centromere protein V [Penicillium desertorum]|uniref:Glutathione-dependent formaldehyde-activating enzyme/centromere protein V n=1 Tax=Penicillium desertorum TaxID=1303715 RepID=A0A9W9WXH2_9EURO|nr:Glutathione-dependent formaldehyde-activating enzyme/centromere protein V [Penicillium desertorum]